MSDAIKEIAGVLKDALVTPVQEAFVYRARNPFFGTLVISWLFYNWNKVAFFFLSDFKIIERIDYIRHKIPDNSVILGINISHTHSFWFPLLWACFISLTFPFFTYASIWIHKKITAHIEVINSSKEIERIRLQKDLMIEMAKNESAKTKQLALEESQIEEHREVTATHKANIETLKKRKATLETEIDALAAVNEASQISINNITSKINEKQDEYEKLNDKNISLLNKVSSLEELKNVNKELENKIAILDSQVKSYLTEMTNLNMKLLEKDKELAQSVQLANNQSKELTFKSAELNSMSTKLDSYGDSIINIANRFNNIFSANIKTGEVTVQEPYVSALESINDDNIITVYPKRNEH
ncbi:hypothetical protein [Pantoea sp. aB]|uniref:hypothetical protein n=1 Tax=Pantoea sp. aB TaxID=517433 RepID=UPI0005343E5D|nr:hypothetical protein [Pantoea sp. aB]